MAVTVWVERTWYKRKQSQHVATAEASTQHGGAFFNYSFMSARVVKYNARQRCCQLCRWWDPLIDYRAPPAVGQWADGKCKWRLSDLNTLDLNTLNTTVRFEHISKQMSRLFSLYIVNYLQNVKRQITGQSLNFYCKNIKSISANQSDI